MKIRYILLALAAVGMLALASCSGETEKPAETGSGTAAESETASGLIDAGVYSDDVSWGPLFGLDN